MNTFSLRAECMADADALRRACSAADSQAEITLSPDDLGLPDQGIEIRTRLSAGQIRSLIRTIPDGLVMLQTVRAVELVKNSLERDYDVL